MEDREATTEGEGRPILAAVSHLGASATLVRDDNRSVIAGDTRSASTHGLCGSRGLIHRSCQDGEPVGICNRSSGEGGNGRRRWGRRRRSGVGIGGVERDKRQIMRLQGRGLSW